MDWLYRKYNYEFNEIKELLDDKEMLSDEDPKVTHARKFLNSPVKVENADYAELLRVPGIGPKTARRIVAMRSDFPRLKREHLAQVGVIMERADPYLKVNGWVQKTIGAY